MVADSLRPDSFGGEELGFLNRLGKLITHLVFVYSRQEQIEFFYKFQEKLTGFVGELQRLKNVRRLYEEIADVVSKSFDFHYMALVAFDNNGQLSVQRVVNKGARQYIAEQSWVSVDNSLVGGVMRSLKPITLPTVGKHLLKAGCGSI